ncbi:MAG: hypothetical protein IPM11_00720 [Micropruina sp.]|nr:hypothetical protein [Micropruina sp.]
MAAVVADDLLRGPELPASVDGWPTRTRQWWDTWRRSAQASTFTATDWDFLLDTAMIHAAFSEGAVALAGELRLRVAKFGATPEDRARLRMAIVPPKPPAEPPAPGVEDEVGARRERLKARTSG